MLRHHQLQRALAAALGAVVCLCSSCTSTRPQQVSPAVPVDLPIPPEPGDRELVLSEAQERRAMAHAQFALALSTELREGLEAALPIYEKALQLDPANTGLAIRLAQVSLTRKDFAAAKQRLQAATVANPAAADPWLWLAFAHRGLEEPAEALNALEQALSLNPSHIQSLALLVEMHLQRDSLDEVVTQLDKAWAQPSREGAFWLGLGKLYTQVFRQKPSLIPRLGENRPREAFTKAVQFAPRDAESLLQLAETSLETGDFTTAADTFARLMKIRPDLPFREKLALTFLRANQKDKAAAIYRELIKRDPTKFENYNALADLQEEAGQETEAIATYQQSLVLNPDQVEVYLRLAMLQLAQEQPAKALQNLATARERFPTVFHVPYVTGIVHSEKKEYAQAVAAFAQAEALIPQDDDETKPTSAFYFSYAAALERHGDFDKAEKLFRKALELDPKNHAAANYLGYMWADKGVNLEEAHTLIQKAVELEADNGAYLDSLGWVLFKLGKPAEALPHLQRAAELVKDDAVVFEHLADVLLALGKRAEAIAQLKRAIAADPDNKELAAKLQKLTNQSVQP